MLELVMEKPVILTVDDDPQVLRAIARDLRQRYGDEYSVLRAESGAHALQALDELVERLDAGEALPRTPEQFEALLALYDDALAAETPGQAASTPHAAADERLEGAKRCLRLLHRRWPRPTQLQPSAGRSIRASIPIKSPFPNYPRCRRW